MDNCPLCKNEIHQDDLNRHIIWHLLEQIDFQREALEDSPLWVEELLQPLYDMVDELRTALPYQS